MGRSVKLRDENGIYFVFAGDTQTKSAGINVNGLLLDRWIDDELAAKFFSASYLIVLTYMHYYEYSISGLVPLSFLAQRPIICPEFSPFREIISQYNVGVTFNCES